MQYDFLNNKTPRINSRLRDWPIFRTKPLRDQTLINHFRLRTGLASKQASFYLQNSPNVTHPSPHTKSKLPATLPKQTLIIQKFFKEKESPSPTFTRKSRSQHSEQPPARQTSKRKIRTISAQNKFQVKKPISRNNFLIIQKYSITQQESKLPKRMSIPKRQINLQELTPKRNFLRTSVVLQKKTRKKPQLVPIKQAMRDRQWLNKAKDQILNDFSTLLNRSNGLLVMRPEQHYFQFKYFVGRGNNSSLVKRIMMTRPQWTRVKKEAKSQSNFVWTQWKDKEFFQDLDCSKHKLKIGSYQKLKIRCTTKYPLLSNSFEKSKRVDLSHLGFDQITAVPSFVSLETSNSLQTSQKIHNKLEANFQISNKKGLFYNLRRYYKALNRDLFQIIPKTFHISGTKDPHFSEFCQIFQSSNAQWILKPGQNTNRGVGITVCSSLEQIKYQIRNFQSANHTVIIQQYISNPLLIHKRKFDIRCFALVTSFNGVLQAYFYQQGYLRTSSVNFSLQNLLNKFIHLTNDAVQKKSDDYGKFEKANKLSYLEFQKYIQNQGFSVNFKNEILPKIKTIVKETIEAVFLKIDPRKRSLSFQIFGYDFMIDENFKPWLLEVNTNPCLELSAPHLARIIPSMLENAFRIALDPVFLQTNGWKRSIPGLVSDTLIENKFELVFHSLVDGSALVEYLGQRVGLIAESDPLVIEDYEEYNLSLIEEESESDDY